MSREFTKIVPVVRCRHCRARIRACNCGAHGGRTHWEFWIAESTRGAVRCDGHLDQQHEPEESA